MKIHHDALYLFDLDGTLIDTEPLYFKAFQQATKELDLPDQSYEQYIELMHLDSGSRLNTFARKKRGMLNRLRNQFILDLLYNHVPILPKTCHLLETLLDQGQRVVIVTNSMKTYIKIIQKHVPLLKRVSHWLTREDHVLLKPDPFPYLEAIRRWGHPNDIVYGFEDSYKGYLSLRDALDQSRARRVINEGHAYLVDKEYPLYHRLEQLYPDLRNLESEAPDKDFENPSDADASQSDFENPSGADASQSDF